MFERKEQSEQFHESQVRKPLYLAKFSDEPATVSLGSGDQRITLHGEILVASDSLGSEIRRVAMRSEPLEELGGTISLIGPYKEAQAAARTESSDVEKEPIVLTARLYYPLLSTKHDPACEESDATYPQMETLRGTVHLELLQEESAESIRVELNLELAEAVEGAVQGFTFGPVEFPCIELSDKPPKRPPQTHSLAPCSGSAPSGTAHELRQLNVRFVNVSGSVPTNQNLENDIQDLVDSACEVWWKKGGVKIAPKPAIDSDSFKGGQVSMTQEKDIVKPPPTGIGHDPDRVDIYLVDKLKDRKGGGQTHNCGTSDAFILLEIEAAKNNKYLLAHELGHVLGLRHPGQSSTGLGAGCQSYREGSYCSIMLPGSPNSSRNTAQNIGVIETSSYPLVPKEFESLGQLGNWNADVEQGFFHIIRDFPYDDGTEVSLQALPVNRWDHSDVWNSDQKPDEFEPGRYEDGTLIFAPDHSPRHTEPHCVNKNYMYVRVHTCQPLAHLVNVDLFLADPGVSPGFEKLVPLRPTTSNPTNHRLVFNSPAPVPGNPATKHLEWLWSEVPSGYPTNCCVFAFAHSNSEPPPFANPTNVTFDDVFPLLGADNDIAQRNLHVQQCAPPSGMPLLPAPFWSTLPWVQMANPFEETVSARIEIDTRQASSLENLTLEVDDQPAQKIALGESVTVNLAEELQPNQRIILRLRATFPPDLLPESSFPIEIRFFADNQLITGYTHVLRVASLAEAMFQMTNALFNALQNVSTGCQVDIQELIKEARNLTQISANNSMQALGDLCALSGKIVALAQELESPIEGAMESQAVQQHLHELADYLDAFPESTSPNLLIEQIRDLANRIQEPAGRLARRL